MNSSPSTATAAAAPRRLFDIDRAKGLAILFVVFGHIVMRQQPEGNEWYQVVRTAIYDFHMPFFMYLSGIVMFYTGAAYTGPDAYPGYLRKRAARLLAPFLLMGLLIYFGKVFASMFMQVDNNRLGVFEGLSALVWNTHSSPATSLWFIFVLFVYYMIVPPLLWLTKGRVWPVAAFAAFCYVLPWPEYIYADKSGHYFLFFMLGGLAALVLQKYESVIDRWRYAFLGAFAASFGLMAFDGVPWLVEMGVIGILSMPALHALVRMKGWNQSGLLLMLGKYCFVIYLFNTICIGVTKGVMFHVLSWNGPNFFLFVPVLFAAGVIGPMLMKYIIFRRIPVLDRMTN